MTTSKDFVVATVPGMRKVLGLTQEEFGKLLGVSKTTISRVECRDTKTLSLSVISRMYDGLKRIEEKQPEISRNEAAQVPDTKEGREDQQRRFSPHFRDDSETIETEAKESKDDKPDDKRSIVPVWAQFVLAEVKRIEKSNHEDHERYRNRIQCLTINNAALKNQIEYLLNEVNKLKSEVTELNAKIDARTGNNILKRWFK